MTLVIAVLERTTSRDFASIVSFKHSAGRRCVETISPGFDISQRREVKGGLIVPEWRAVWVMTLKGEGEAISTTQGFLGSENSYL
jgi:hypothetical protein